MAPQVEAVYPTPHPCSNLLATDVSLGRERVLIGEFIKHEGYRRITRLDLATGTRETITIEGIFSLTSLAAAPDGGFFVVDCYKRLHRLDERGAIVASEPESDAVTHSLAATDGGFVAVVTNKKQGPSGAPQAVRYRHALVRYSDDLQKQWQVDLPHRYVRIQRRSFSPVIALAARGADRYFVASPHERAYLLEIPDPREAVRVHEVGLWPQNFAGLVRYEGTPFVRRPVVYSVRRKASLLPLFWGACWRPEDNAVILLDWPWSTVDVERQRERTGYFLEETVTGFLDCRFDETTSRFRTHFCAIHGSFLSLTALSRNRIAAVGLLGDHGERDKRVLAVIRLPDPPG